VLSQHLLDGIRINRLQPRIYFGPATLVPFGISRRTTTISLVHDLAPFKVAGIYTMQREKYHRWLLGSVARRADHLVSVSAATKQDLVEILGVRESKISVIPNATDAEIFRGDPGEIDAQRKRLGLPPRFILFVGKIQPRKNLSRLIQAFNALAQRGGNEDLCLLIAGGKGWLDSEIKADHESSPVKDRILFRGHLPDADLAWHYRCATVFCYPSLYEGFGLPILESMASGVPVVTSSIGAMVEVASDAAITCDPYDTQALEGAMSEAIGNAGKRKTLIERGYRRAQDFSWKKSAEQYADLWNRFF
jgi:glycosyltransferase involved in cell wall biosynthesis